MALLQLVARLEQEAQNQVEAIDRAADAEVRAIEADTERAVREAEARHLQQGTQARERAQQRDLSQLARLLRARELEARHAHVRRILDRARERISDVAGTPDYAAVLPGHLDEALSYLDGVAVRVRCARASAALLAAHEPRRPDLDLVIDDALGSGLIAEAADGSVIVDNTLAARLARAEPELVIALARELDDGDR